LHDRTERMNQHASVLLSAGVALLRQLRPRGVLAALTAARVPSRTPATRYFLSVVVVAFAAGARWWLVDAAGPLPPFLTFYPAVILVAILAGGGPGVAALILSALYTDYAFIPPLGSLAVGGVADSIALGTFVCSCLILCALAQRLRQAQSAEAATRRQWELVNVAMASIGEGVIVTDVVGRVAFINRAAETLLGCTTADVDGLPLTAVFKTKGSPSPGPITTLSDSVLRRGVSIEAAGDTVLSRQDGRELPVELNAAPILENGGVRGMVLAFRDCSERKRSEDEVRRLFDAVRAEKEWLSAVLGSINEEVYFTDTQSRYVYANPAALREFGHISAEDVDLEKMASSLVVLRPDGSRKPTEEDPPLRALAGEVVRDEEQIVRIPRTGELRNRQVSSAPVRDGVGNIIGSVSVVRDITERKRVEASLREADYRKNVFLATLSHELRNPLAPIRTAARLLESANVAPADLQRCQSIISRQVALMASLLNDLLDVSRFTRGELKLRKAYVPLQHILDAAVETAQPLLNAKHHQMRIELPSSALMLEVDPVRLTQVVSNLLTNAAKYTNAGGEITLECHLETDALVIAIHDTGIGLSPERFNDVFEMFVQLEPANERAEGGLGIGLALVKGLVELHGGRIDVHSAGRGQGSTFTVRLPQSVVVESRQAIAAPTHSGPPGSKSRRVLIADDNPDGAETIAMLLRMSGHEVHVAHNGTEALELATREKPDVALLDIGMPGLSGYELATRIRGEAWGAHMTLIAVTGWGQEEDKRKSRAAGFDHHFTKPMDPVLLESIFEPTVLEGLGGA
jgi:PAS domain S-box-containing protein